MKVDNYDEICQCFHRDYPSSKIILTVPSEQECLSSIRFFAKNQGIDEILVNFQQENLLIQGIININTIFQYLDYPPLEEEQLVKVLEYFENKNTSAFATQKEIQLKNLSESTKTSDIVKFKIPVSKLRLAWFIVIGFSILILLEVSSFPLLSPVQRLQQQIAAKNQEQNQEKQKQIKILTLKQVETVPQGTFNYGGSTTWASIRKVINPQIAQEYPEFSLRYLSPINTTPGSGAGIRMLLEGQLDFSQSSRPIKQKEHLLARDRGFTLKEYPIAIDAIAIAVNPDLKVSGLTVEQLKKIYLGQITNWKEVNGPDLEIVPFSRKAEDGGTPEFFKHHVLDSESFGSNVQFVYSTTDGLRETTNAPGGIYYASAPQIVPQCTVKALPMAAENGQSFIAPYLTPAIALENCPQQRNQINVEVIRNGSYPITRYLSVIVREDGTRSQEAGEAYIQLLITQEIQQLIQQAGFVSIN